MLLLRDSPAIAAAVPAASPRLPRVLAVTAGRPGSPLGSGEVWRTSVADAFHREGSCFLSVYNAPAESLGSENRHRHAVAFEHMPFSLAGLGRLVRLIREHRIDIVNWNFVPALSNPYVWALTAACPGVRHWLTEHISQPTPFPPSPGPIARAVRRTLLGRYERVVCVSGFVAGYLGTRGYDGLTTSHLFVDTDRFRPDPQARAGTRRRLGLGDRFVVLFTSHLIAAKGGSVAIAAMRSLGEDAVLLVVGDGPDESRQKAEAAPLGDRVMFLGRQDDVAPYMQTADALVCPSLWAEAAGLVNMEAQACGLPVVASRIGGIPEIVEDERTGLLFAPGDTVALAAALARLRADTELHARMSDAARARALERFSITARLPAYLDLYRNRR